MEQKARPRLYLIDSVIRLGRNVPDMPRSIFKVFCARHGLRLPYISERNFFNNIRLKILKGKFRQFSSIYQFATVSFYA